MTMDLQDLGNGGRGLFCGFFDVDHAVLGIWTTVLPMCSPFSMNLMACETSWAGTRRLAREQ